MEKYDWSQFKCRIVVKALPEEIYKAWATPQSLENWFLRKASFVDGDGKPVSANSFLKPGDRYEWYWFGYDDNTVERGKILVADGSSHIGFTFGDPNQVEVHMTAVQDGTLVELRQYAIPLDEESKVRWHLGCLSGWTFYLANLKSILEGGLDLRNKNEALTGMLNS